VSWSFSIDLLLASMLLFFWADVHMAAPKSLCWGPSYVPLPTPTKAFLKTWSDYYRVNSCVLCCHARHGSLASLSNSLLLLEGESDSDIDPSRILNGKLVIVG